MQQVAQESPARITSLRKSVMKVKYHPKPTFPGIRRTQTAPLIQHRADLAAKRENKATGEEVKWS